MLDNELNEYISKIKKLEPFLTESRWDRIQNTIKNRTLNIVPVLEHIYDRGNISAVMRSAEAFGFINFHIVERPDGQFKTSNRVTQGTDKWLKIKKHKETKKCLGELKERGFKIYATHLNATVAIDEIDFTQASAVILGNEKEGVSEEALEMCDDTFIIPMFGFAQSFNISVAGALCFYHIHKYRLEKMGSSGDLCEKDAAKFTLEYMCKSIKGAEKILNYNK
ncbi:MAG: RNA methyltransferase [Bdellovibrionaceae bacterium]|nr:RNA methyltransferase [Pseudobdellovibrionaceae bacterium]